MSETIDLSSREKEIQGLLLLGNTNKEIGRELGISYRTVETHRKHIYEKLGVTSYLSFIRKLASEKRICPHCKEPI